MTKGNKALFTSALICPGAGHIILRCYKSAALIIAITVAAVFIIARHIWMTASHVVEKILSEGTQPSFFTLREMIHQQQTATASALVDAAVITVIVIWVIALLDVYRINKATIKSS